MDLLLYVVGMVPYCFRVKHCPCTSLHLALFWSMHFLKYDNAPCIGIWYEWADEVKEICAGGDLTVSRVHTHIGSGSDPAVWQKVTGALA